MPATIRKEFPVRNAWGTSLKIAIRDEAKRLPLYWWPIRISPLVTGESDDGDIIPINNLGRWVFGVPGYRGHITVEGFSNNIAFRCPNVPEAVQLLTGAVEALCGAK